jgi:nitric oxide reductase NorD protein
MEEFVGKIWDRFITNSADTHYPDAVVHLDEVRHTAGIFFRALGGEGGLSIKAATDANRFARRSLLQRIAGTGKTTQYAWRDEESLRLPDSIALFPTKELNRDLYLWLTAISVISGEGTDWISRNQNRTLKTLEIWPGLKNRYQHLLQAHLDQRPLPDTLPAREASQENNIRLALSDSTKNITLEYAKHPPQPVSLWLHPSPPQSEISPGSQQLDPDQDESSEDAENKKDKPKQVKRKQGDRTDMPDGNDGLMSFRLETLWSWAEYTKVDRSSIEDDDDDAMKTAEDMDNITLAQDSETTTGKIKLDLDLPSEEYDDLVLTQGIPIDEWDYKQQCMQKDYCRLQEMISKQAEAMALPERLRPQAHKVRRQFESLRPQRHWVSRQNDGTELDLENYINFLTDRKHGHVNDDTPVYRDIRNVDRDLSCLLLADLSLSTDAYINNNDRVIDVIRDSLYLFSEALTATGDRFALHGFSSRNRNHIRFYNIKGFDETYNDEIRGHINAIRPGYYTRMGAAIRHATQLLLKEASNQKLLLIITDGKPNDLDKYEGRYGIEDTRMAVLEAERQGLRPFCITIDEQAEDYLPYIFGSRSYALVHNAEELPRKSLLLYLKLTS